MPVLMIVAIALLAGAASHLLWLSLAGTTGAAKAVRSNLDRGLRTHAVRLGGKVARPLPVRRLAGPRIVAWIEGLSLKAGHPERWPVERILAVKLIAPLAGGLLGLLIVLRAGTSQSVLLAVLLTFLAFFLPDLLLWNTAIKRRQAAALELPETLDQMSIAVEAGLGFDAAMVRVARNGKGVLAGELVRTLQDIQVGQPRRMAYERLAARVGDPALRRFMRSVIQAEEYGIPLADVLNTQAREMRIERRQRAERKAMEIPVKVTFPLVLFLMPALFVVILGPAVLSMIAAFTK